MTHEVTVGNIGTVYNGTDKNAASYAFNTYCEQSMFGRGRASGETVTWFRDGEIYEEFEQ